MPGEAVLTATAAQPVLCGNCGRQIAVREGGYIVSRHRRREWRALWVAITCEDCGSVNAIGTPPPTTKGETN